MSRLRAFLADWALANMLKRRCTVGREQWLIERRSDGTTWAGGHPQNFAYTMRGLFLLGWEVHPGSWHFYRVREWRGLMIASRKVFWLPESGLDFRLRYRVTMFELPPFSEAVECLKIDLKRRRQAKAA